VAGDNLFAILAMIRAELPEDQRATLDQIKRLIGTHAGGGHVYVPQERKRTHLEAIAAAGENATAEQLSKQLGVSVRRVQQLKRLRG
jgi:hypothetical protein